MTGDLPAPVLSLDAVVELVEARPGASFPEMQQYFGPPSQGEYSMSMRDDLIIWAGVSEPFAELLGQAINDGRLHLHGLGQTEAWLIHTADGGFLNLPMAKQVPARGYKKPHWVPVVFYVGSGCTAKNCLGVTARARTGKG